MRVKAGERVSLPPAPRTGAWARWGSLLIQVSAGAAMLIWTWGTWPDVLIDFGRELYVPWRLVQGAALYHDIAYFNGPFSPLLNALWFLLLGSSLRTLVICNLALLVLLLLIMERLLLAVSDRLAATAAGLVFLLLFAFGQYVVVGNFNYVCPYSHELPHGLLLSFGAFYTLHRFQCRPRRAWIGATGVLLGLVFLTKPEVFAATGVALCVGLALTLYKSCVRGTHLAQALAIFIVSAVAPALLFYFLLLACSTPAGEAFHGILGAWPWVSDRELTSLRFYRRILGTDETLTSLQALVASAGVFGAALLATAVVALALRGPRWRGLVGTGVWTVLSLAALLIWQSRIPWLNLLRPLPIALTVVSATLAVQVLRSPRQDPRGARAILGLTLTLFALLLLAKMVLNVHIFHYGFALAMPGAMILVIALTGWLPRWVERRGGAGLAVRVSVLAAIGLTAVFHLQEISSRLEWKTAWVGTGPDRFRADPRAKLVNATLDLLTRTVGPGQTLAVVPEGVMLNFLTRRVNPTPFFTLLPVELIMFGEEPIVSAFERSPPDFIAVLPRPVSEFGYQGFGRDYGQKIQAWIDAHYETEKLLGGMPGRDESAGVLLLRRRNLWSASDTDPAAKWTAPGSGTTERDFDSRPARP